MAVKTWQITLVYVLTSHILLYASSPAYKYELHRLSRAVLAHFHSNSEQHAWRAPRSGIYRSSALLQAVQEHMRLNSTSNAYMAPPLVAYMSVNDLTEGQGWKARATMFVQLMAPRYTLLPIVHPSLRPLLRLLELAAGDLPAVGRLAGSADADVGYRLSCSSPAMQFSLGPQPVAVCTVWNPPNANSTKKLERVLAAHGIGSSSSSSSEMRASGASKLALDAVPTSSLPIDVSNDTEVVSTSAAKNGAGTCPATWALFHAVGAAQATCSSSVAVQLQPKRQRIRAKHSRPPPVHEKAAAAATAAAAGQPIATWTILGSTAGGRGQAAAAAAAQSLHEADPLPVLGAPVVLEPPAGGLLRLVLSCDTWFIFPRAPLMRLLPAMTGWEQLLYAHAVVKYSWADLVFIISTMQHLHMQARQADPFMAHQHWSVITAACAVSLQLLTLLVTRMLVTTCLSLAAVVVVYHILQGLGAAALLAKIPILQGLAALLTVRMAVRQWLGWFIHTATTAVKMVRVGVSSSAAAAGPSTGAAEAFSAAAASAASTTQSLGHEANGGHDEAFRLLRSVIQPKEVLLLHSLCLDLMLLSGAHLVWELQELVCDTVWKLLQRLGIELQVLLEASAAGVALLLHGASWRVALQRFLQLQQLQLQQRRAEAAAAMGVGNGGGGGDQRVQAQVFIQAPGDMGQAADALRNLADELEQLGVNPGGWFGGAGARRGGTRRQLQALGNHWPSPLEVPFDVEELQSELGVEVPRGFVCPITQDIMRLPALLISSTVSVPATYDREAIVRWLEDSRRDPKSRQLLAADAQLVPNMDLYRAIEDYIAEKAVQLAAKAADQGAAAPEEAAAHEDAHPPLPAVAATAAAPTWQQAGEGAVIASAAGRLQARPSTSAGAVCSGLLAAVRGAVGDGLGSLGRMRGAGAGAAGTAAAAAADGDGDVDLPSDDDEVNGPARAAATAAVNRSSPHAVVPFDQQWQQSQQAPAQLLPQSVLDPSAGGSMAAAAEAAGPALQQQQQQQGVGGGRYHFRQRRSPSHTAGR